MRTKKTPPHPSQDGGLNIFVTQRIPISDSHFSSPPNENWQKVDPKELKHGPSVYTSDGFRDGVYYRDTGMYVEIGFATDVFESSFASLRAKRGIEKPANQPARQTNLAQSEEDHLRELRDELLSMGAEDVAVDEMLEKTAKTGHFPPKPKPCDVVKDSFELFIDQYTELFSFADQLTKIEKEIGEVVERNFTIEEQIALKSPNAPSVSGWKHHVFKAKSLCGDLRIAQCNRWFNFAVKTSLKLGEEMATMRFRRDFEQHIVVQRRVKNGGVRGTRTKQLTSKRKADAAVAELVSRLSGGGRKTKTGHLKDMAKEMDESGKEPRWGKHRMLVDYCKGVEPTVKPKRQT